MTKSGYTGRFAPSPTGPLHFGSVISALASFLDARSQGGTWKVRIDDIDQPRCVEGMDSTILRTLETLGLHWDDDVTYQSNHLQYYQDVFQDLVTRKQVYPCYCPRKLTKGKPYPGTCRSLVSNDEKQQFCMRLITDETPVCFTDRILGEQSANLVNTTGDFIIRRADSLFSYNLAVVIDDNLAGMTTIVRGADLIDTTFNQIYIYSLLGYHIPEYAHHAVIADLNGKKLSKQHGAVDVLTLAEPGKIVLEALRFLGQKIQPGLIGANISEIIDWAIDNWTMQFLPQEKQINTQLPL